MLTGDGGVAIEARGLLEEAAAVVVAAAEDEAEAVADDNVDASAAAVAMEVEVEVMLEPPAEIVGMTGESTVEEGGCSEAVGEGSGISGFKNGEMSSDPKSFFCSQILFETKT